jgi:hypothetical protein
MNKGVPVFILLFIIMGAVAYVEVHSYFKGSSSTTTLAGSSSSITIPTSNQTTTIFNLSQYVINCGNFNLYLGSSGSNISGKCRGNGSLIGLWIAAGNAGTERVTITAGNTTYVNQSSTYACKTFYENFTLPPQIYKVTLYSGSGGGSCGSTSLTLNTTTIPPNVVRNFVYNGNFGTGTFVGWQATGSGFGTAPLNITRADKRLCYIGEPWSGYNGTFFATTFNCGVSTGPGNITSSPFVVNPSKPFLNFKVISPDDSFLYAEVLVNNTPQIIAHYNTYNTSLDFNASSTFRNATMDLSYLVGKVVRVRVVASSSSELHFIAVGDFAISSRPLQQQGIISNITYNFT